MAPILVGPATRSATRPQQFRLDIARSSSWTRRTATPPPPRPVELVRAGRAELLMKGSLHTDELMSAVVAKETGLRTRGGSAMCSLWTCRPTRPVFITDAAINIVPDLATKSTSSRTRSTCISGWAWVSRAWRSCRRSRP